MLVSGLDSIYNGRNEGTTGLIREYAKDNLQSCAANVTFKTWNNEETAGGPIIVPCDDGAPGQAIDLCYNHGNPYNFAFADHNHHLTIDDKNPFGFCAGIGYGSAKKMIYAAIIITAVVAACYVCFIMTWLSAKLYYKIRKTSIQRQKFVTMV